MTCWFQLGSPAHVAQKQKCVDRRLWNIALNLGSARLSTVMECLLRSPKDDPTAPFPIPKLGASGRHGVLDDQWLILADGFTPRSGPASCRALAAASPAFVRALILSPWSFATMTMTMMRTVSRLAFGISAATKSTQRRHRSRAQVWQGEVKAVFYCQPRRFTLSADRASQSPPVPELRCSFSRPPRTTEFPHPRPRCYRVTGC